MAKYIWQKPNWPDFHWKAEQILLNLSQAKKNQGFVLGQAQFLELKHHAEFLVEETLATSAIEGEMLDKNGIRSSVARRLGLPTAGLSGPKRNGDGVVEMLLDATQRYNKPLSQGRLFGWQSSLFPTGFSGIDKITVGAWRKGDEPMRVVSGSMGKEIVHYEAPPSKKVSKEMEQFLKWWNTKDIGVDGLIRAGIAHLWFVTIHPFDDGNGRIARAITDMALAQDESNSMRTYSLSSQILKEREDYYEILEKTQKGNGDITEWLQWFLGMFARGLDNSRSIIERSIFIGKFYSHYGTALNERQGKVLKKMLEVYPEEFTGGMTNQKYVSITRVSSETAKRDIKDLVDKKIFLQNEGGGRSTSYRLNGEL